MFRIPPDHVHNGLLRTGSFMQQSTAMRTLITHSWNYQRPILSQTIHGIQFRNPIGLSAGFDKNAQLIPLLKAVGFGFAEVGTITNHASKGNSRPWFHRLPKSKSLVVHAGLANQGIPAVTKRIRQYPAETFEQFPLNISIAQTNSKQVNTEKKAIADCIAGIQTIQKANVGTFITINISCPNTFHGEPFTTPRALNRLLAAIDALQITQPLFLKMPSDLSWPAFAALLDVAATHTIAGLTIGNLTKNRNTPYVLDSLPEHIKGGLSGRPTFDITNQLIYQTRKHYGDRFTIIGVGGVFSAEDAYKKIRLGADLVSLITGMIYEGPQRIGQINEGLARLLRRDGFQSIADAVGIDC